MLSGQFYITSAFKLSIRDCVADETQHTELPEEGTTVTIEKHFKKLKAPFAIYGVLNKCLTTETPD